MKRDFVLNGCLGLVGSKLCKRFRGKKNVCRDRVVSGGMFAPACGIRWVDLRICVTWHTALFGHVTRQELHI